MTIFRSSVVATWLALMAATAAAGATQAQVTDAISLQPLGDDESTVTVRNVYGRCGGAVVQVLGVLRKVENFFLVDPAASNADIVVIAKLGHELHLRDFMSDYNGVACVGGAHKRLVTWSSCSGSACSDNFNFTVIDPAKPVVVAGGRKQCDAACAALASGSELPRKLNR